MLLCKSNHCIQPLKAIGSVVDSGGTVADQLKPCSVLRNCQNICKKCWTTGLMRERRYWPLNAHVLTTLIPWLEMLARVVSISASEFNTDNQYAFVPTNLNFLNYSMSGCWEVEDNGRTFRWKRVRRPWPWQTSQVVGVHCFFWSALGLTQTPGGRRRRPVQGETRAWVTRDTGWKTRIWRHLYVWMEIESIIWKYCTLSHPPL